MNLKYIALFFLLSQLFQLNGQTAKEMERINADSLQQILPTLTGTEKIDALNKIAFKLCYKYPDSCISMAIQTIRLSETIDYKKGEATGYFNLGNGYFFLDSIKQSVTNYLYALRIFENIDVCIEMGLTLHDLSLLNWRAGRLEIAIKQIKQQIQIAQQLSDIHYETGLLIRMSANFTKVYKFDSANIYLDKAFALLLEHPDTLLLSSAYLYKGYNLLRHAGYLRSSESKDSVDYYYKETINWLLKFIDLEKTYDFNSNTDFPHYISIYHNLAWAYLNLNTHEDTITGLKYLYKEKSMVDTLSTVNRYKLYTYNLLGILKRDAGDYRAAIDLYEEGIKRAEEARKKFNIKNYDRVGNPISTKISEDFYYNEVLSWIYRNTSNVYKQLGDYKSAHEFYVLKEKARNEIFLEDNRNLISILEAESENEKIQNQIAELERDKQLNELKVVQTRNLNIGLIIVFIILLLVGILFLRQNKLKNEHKSTLLEQKLLRLQMNPHFIFNALSSIHSLMNPKDVNKASEYLGNFSRLLRSSLESSREDYILLEEEISSIKNYLELQQLRYEKKFDYKIDVDPKIDLESAILPPMLLQPFIENAIEHGIKHKEAKGHIRIRFKLENKKLTCEIEDDGVGREKAWEVEYAKKGKHKSLATEIIHDRIKILNKKLKQNISLNIADLKSEANEAIGTLVMLDLPYLKD